MTIQHTKLYFSLACIFLLVFSISVIIFTRLQNTSPFLTTNRTQLLYHNRPYTFVGFNTYSLASLPGHNAGCGGYVQDIDGLFASLRPNSIVRLWAWQGSMAINPKTKKLDWTGIDRVLQAAQKYQQKVILSLGTQTGVCDDQQWKDSAWYQGGFTQVTNTSGLTPFSYWEYVQRIVRRYKNSPAIAMWEPINEPETSDCTGYVGTACYGHQTCMDHAKSAAILRKFFDTLGGQIKHIDHHHLVESGTIGTGQCGSDNAYYTYIHQSPAIDVASYHDYNDEDHAIPGDQWNGLRVRLSQMKALAKPLIIGEAGIVAVANGKNCITLSQRAKKIKAKMDALFPAGIAGFLLWSRSPSPDTTCNYDIGNNDPLVSLLNNYRLPLTPAIQ